MLKRGGSAALEHGCGLHIAASSHAVRRPGGFDGKGTRVEPPKSGVCGTRAAGAQLRASIPGQEEIAIDLSTRIVHLCVDYGDSITGGARSWQREATGHGLHVFETRLEDHATGALGLRSESACHPRQTRTRLCGEESGPTPGLEVVEVEEASLCSGFAGVYNLLNPEPASQLGDRKVDRLLATGRTL